MDKDLRKLKVNISTADQTPVIAQPFDPIWDTEAAVLYFTGPFCLPCAKMTPYYAQLQQTFPNIPAIAIAQDPPERLIHYYDKVKGHINYTISAVTPELWEALIDDQILAIAAIPHATILSSGVVIYNGHPGEPAFKSTLEQLSTRLKQEQQPQPPLQSQEQQQPEPQQPEPRQQQ